MSKRSTPTESAKHDVDKPHKHYPDDVAVKLTDAPPICDPRDLGPLFVKSPRLLGEDETLYDELLSKITAAVAPGDVIEAICVKEFVDRIWDSLFYQRVRARFLRDAQTDALKRLLKLDDHIIAGWVAGDKTATAVIEDTLKKLGYDWDAVRVRALANGLDKLDQLERLIERANARRDKALYILERRRDSRGRPLPQVIEGTRADRPRTL
jgi:hypothetical protein